MMRPFKTAFHGTFLPSYQAGVMGYAYRGVPCLKSPTDIAIYYKAIWDLQPRTVIEIGSHSGGSTLLLADNPQAFAVDIGLCDMFGQNATYAPNGYLRNI